MFQSGQTMFRLAAHAAFVGALAAALALGGCGRKGALDPPPGSSAQPPETSAQPPAAQDQSGSGEAAAPAAYPTTDADGRPIAPRGQNKKLPIDWLID